MDSTSVRAIDTREAVRLRPAMYIGGTDALGLHHTFVEVSDNAVNEAMAGHCNRIDVKLHSDGSLSVRDNGRGIPVGPIPQDDRPFAETVLTRLHPFMPPDRHRESPNTYQYRVSGGMHGVGLFVVGCVSACLTAEVWRDGGHHRIVVERGCLTEPIARLSDARETGTCIRWLPDPQVFGDLAFEPPCIRLRLRELAFLNPAVTLTLRDERHGGGGEVFHEPAGAVAFGQFLNAGRETIGPVIPFGGRQGDIEIEGALQYRADSGTVLACYANMVRMNSGIHETTLFAGLTRALNRQARRLEVALPGGRALRRVQTQHGLTAVVSLKLERPLNTSATRTRLENPQVVAPLQRAVRAALDAALDAEPHIARLILAHIRNAKPPTDTGLAWHRFW